MTRTFLLLRNSDGGDDDAGEAEAVGTGICSGADA
jgi:hypothetical protein